jgi:hypothetical protein
MGWERLLAITSTTEPDLEATLATWSIRVVGVTSLLVVTLLIYASRQKRMKNKKKKTLFVSIVSLIMASTIFLFGTTIYINMISDSKGPVHWHSDIEFWVCDTEVELRDPTGFLSNKIGSATYHEHNDKRIHLEGVVVDKEYDASLEKFMVVTNGLITDTRLAIPTNQDFVEDDPDGDPVGDSSAIKKYHTELDSGWVIDVNNGDTCGEEVAEIQVFVISYNKNNDTYSQRKVADPKSYTLRDESVVPPGDCVIVEFAPRMDRTDKLCLQYGIRDTNRCEIFSGKEKNDKLCTIYETTAGGAQ